MLIDPVFVFCITNEIWYLLSTTLPLQNDRTNGITKKFNCNFDQIISAKIMRTLTLDYKCLCVKFLNKIVNNFIDQ